MSPSSGEAMTLVHPNGTTRFFVGRGALDAARSDLTDWLESRQIFLVTSAAVSSRSNALIEGLRSSAGELVTLEVPDGEGAKSLDVVRSLWEGMLDAGGRRDSRLVALGGGSVGDVGGFAAATFLRGIAFAVVPTTLLAQVDASIGGKTAIDLPRAKNVVGAFWHPDWVLADVDTLRSLPPAELRSGMVEVVKIAAAADVGLFERLERDMEAALGGDWDLLEEIVCRAVEAKIRVVEADPGEGDRRRILNLGHTLAHAVETVLGYEGIRHGEAVAHGLRFSLRLAARRGGDAESVRRVGRLLDQLEPPPLPDVAVADLLAAIEHDKKARRSGMVWVVPREVGAVEVVSDLDVEAVKEELEGFLAAPVGGSGGSGGGVR